MSIPALVVVPELDAMEDAAELRREVERLQAALGRIVERAQDMTLDLPDGNGIPRTMAVGHVLTLSGIAEAALVRN